MLAAGTQLGPYRILSPLGAGGMGEVYRARDQRLDRDVAVKVLPAEFARDPTRAARFEREAKAVAALDHPNVLAIHEFETHDGVLVAVTEFLEGETLRQRLERGPVGWREAVTAAAAVADGLAAAHAKGIVHRDLKPENLFLTADGRVKILDFGLARAEPAAPAPPQAETGPYVPGLTATGTVMGTVGYMSPEQVRGGPVDARSDLFSLGCVLHEMLTGRRPFDRPTRADVFAATLNSDPPDVAAAAPDVPAAVGRLVRRCLEKDPVRRHQSARDLAHDLRALLADPGPAARGPSRRLALAVAVVAVLVAGGLVARSWLAAPAPSDPGGPKRVAVLPLVNEAGDAETDLTEEVTDLLIGRFQVRGALVRPYAAVAAFKGDRPDLSDVGRKLQVDYLVVGRLRRGGQLMVELVDVATGGPVWRETYPFVGEDVYGHIARQALTRMGVSLSAEEARRLASRLTDSRESLNRYLKGQKAFKAEVRAQTDEAIGHYKDALRADPNFALAHLGLGYAWYWLSGIHEDPRTVMPEAEREARRALELDDSLGDAHALLGVVASAYHRDWPAAGHHFRAALDRSPNSPNVRIYYALYLSMVGRTAEALDEVRQTRDLDPLSPEIPGYASLPYYFARRYDQAAPALKAAVAADPKSVNLHAFLGLNLEQMGPDRLGEAIREFEQARRLDGENGNPETVSQLGHAYALAGREAEAETILEQLKASRQARYVSAYNLALVHVGLGQYDDAFRELDRAGDERTDWFACLKVDPRLDPLRGDPRFADLLRKARLPAD